MKYLLLSLLVFSNFAMSADKKTVAQVKPTITTDKTLDVTPESTTEEVSEKTGLYTNKHSMKAQITCKNSDGREIKQGQKGYKECLKNVKTDDSNVKVKFEK